MTLFTAAVGSFDLAVFENLEFGHFGQGLMMVYVVWALILLLNLVIARMTTRHDEINQHARNTFAINLATNCKHYQLLNEDSVFCMLPAPFNAIPMLCMPLHYFYIWNRCRHEINGKIQIHDKTAAHNNEVHHHLFEVISLAGVVCDKLLGVIAILLFILYDYFVLIFHVAAKNIKFKKWGAKYALLKLVRPLWIALISFKILMTSSVVKLRVDIDSFTTSRQQQPAIGTATRSVNTGIKPLVARLALMKDILGRTYPISFRSNDFEEVDRVNTTSAYQRRNIYSDSDRQRIFKVVEEKMKAAEEGDKISGLAALYEEKLQSLFAAAERRIGRLVAAMAGRSGVSIDDNSDMRDSMHLDIINEQSSYSDDDFGGPASSPRNIRRVSSTLDRARSPLLKDDDDESSSSGCISAAPFLKRNSRLTSLDVSTSTPTNSYSIPKFHLILSNEPDSDDEEIENRRSLA
jgi:hypothetical protein